MARNNNRPSQSRRHRQLTSFIPQPRGYVIVRKSSYLYHISTEEIETLFNVHGGITCLSILSLLDIETWGKKLHLTDDDVDHIILGFDTGHYGSEKLNTRELVLEEATKLQLQIASYG